MPFCQTVFFEKIKSDNVFKYTPSIKVLQHFWIWWSLSYSAYLSSSTSKFNSFYITLDNFHDNFLIWYQLSGFSKHTFVTQT